MVYVQALVQGIRERLAQEAETGGVPSEVVMFCLSAIEKFSKMSDHEIQRCAFEIVALLGTERIKLSSPEKRYTLESIEGTFSGPQLACYAYVGLKRIGCGVDIGFDLSKDYEAALRLSTQP